MLPYAIKSNDDDKDEDDGDYDDDGGGRNKYQQTKNPKEDLVFCQGHQHHDDHSNFPCPCG